MCQFAKFSLVVWFFFALLFIIVHANFSGRTTIATEMIMRHSTTYVNERNLIAFVDIDETYHIAHIFPHIPLWSVCVCVYFVCPDWRLSYFVSILLKKKTNESEEFRVINGLL